MTLIIAKIIEGKIQIESDTKISGENVVRNNPIKGRLKSLILSHNLTVCYAGDIELGEDAYNFFIQKAKTKIEWQDYLNYLQELSGTKEVDFILAGYSPNPFIIKIKDRQIEQSESAWIGDYSAFTEFQSYFLSDSKNNKQSEWFSNCFGKVVDSQLNQSVGEFHVTVKTNSADFKFHNKTVPVFQYQLKSSLTLGRAKTVSFKEKGIPEPIPSGNAEDGTYTISYFTNFTQEWAALGVYFEIGAFGILFCPGDLLRSKKYAEENAQDFVNKVYNDTKIELKGLQALKDTIGFKYIGPEI